MAGFMQIIEMQTSRIDEVEALIRELRDRLDDGGSSAPRRGTMTADRDREGFYLSVVEFDSYEAAMENSDRPEVGEYAARLAKLCDAPAEVLQPRRPRDVAAPKPVTPASERRRRVGLGEPVPGRTPVSPPEPDMERVVSDWSGGTASRC